MPHSQQGTTMPSTTPAAIPASGDLGIMRSMVSRETNTSKSPEAREPRSRNGAASRRMATQTCAKRGMASSEGTA